MLTLFQKCNNNGHHGLAEFGVLKFIITKNINKEVYMIVELNEQNFDKEIESGLKLIEFYATWCSYCMKQRIELKELEHSEQI